MFYIFSTIFSVENKRAANWSELEKEELIKQINTADNWDKLYGKLKRSTTQQDKKALWKEITDAVNMIGFHQRTCKEIRKQHSNLKGLARKNITTKFQTGGWTPPESNSENDFYDEVESKLPKESVLGLTGAERLAAYLS